MLSPEWQPAWTKHGYGFVAVMLLAVFLLLPLLYVGLYNHPSPVDDYGNAAWDNYFGVQLNYYLKGTGRYFSSLLVLLSPWHWHSLAAYRIVCILLIVLFVFVFAGLVRRCLSAYTNAPGIVCTTVGSATVLLLLNNMTSLTEGFFWYTGAVTYILSAVLMAFLLRIAISVESEAQKKPAAGRYILSVLLVMAIVGSNEVIMVLCDAFCLCWFLYSRSRKQPAVSRFLLVLCGVCLVCSLVSILSPGNAIRQGRQASELWIAIPNWLYFSQKLALSWMLDPFLLLYSAVFLIIFSQYRLTKRVTSLFAAFLTPLAVLFLLSFPTFYSLGNGCPPRVRNIVYIFFVPGWIFFLLHLSMYLQELIGKAGRSASGIRQLMLIGVIVGLMGSVNSHDLRLSNFFLVIKGLAKGIPQRYSAELDTRYKHIRTAGDTIVVTPLTATANNVLYFDDISTDPGHHRNRNYAYYWHKGSIRVLSDSLLHITP